MLADMIGFFLFVCLLLIIGDSSLSYKSKRTKKNMKGRKTSKKEMQTNKKEKKILNNCFSTILIFFSLIVNILSDFLPSCKERSVEQKGAGSIKRY